MVWCLAISYVEVWNVERALYILTYENELYKYKSTIYTS